MILTDKYLFVHFPKTGGTFVTKVLQDFFDRENLLYKRLFIEEKNPYTKEIFGQHGGCNEIPQGLLKNRFIVSIIRNPFELYVSQYEFKLWQNKSPEQTAQIKQNFSNYPDLKSICK